MNKIRPKPIFRVLSVVLLLSALLLNYAAPAAFFSKPICALLTLVSTIVGVVGIDTEVSEDEIRIGFSRIKAIEITDSTELENGYFQIRTSKKVYLIKKWIFRENDWEHLRMWLEAKTQMDESSKR